ncbi:MAG: hypothetical protein NZM25_01795 [Leptospiraceae bacterium]|nr:hypothetical protein [Leptospiraceae bacterium]
MTRFFTWQIIFGFVSSLVAQSIFVYTGFDSSSNPPGWVNDGRVVPDYGGAWNNAWPTAHNFGIAYGRVGVLKDTSNNDDQTVRVINSMTGVVDILAFRPGLHTHQIQGNFYYPGTSTIMRSISYLGLSIGRMALYDGLAVNASPQRPVGWQITRIRARLDPHDDNLNPESHRHANRMSFYVFDSTNQSSVFGHANATFPHIISLYETYRAQRPTTADPRSTWGFFTSAENEFNLTNATRPDGQPINLNVGGIWWRYDDECVGFSGPTTYGCAGQNSSNNVNSHPLGLRISTDGELFYFYINPDPDGNNQPISNANEYILVGTAPATFSNNLKAMIGVESERYDTEMQWAEFDNFLMRSVTDGNPANTRAEIYPYAGNVGQTVNFNIIINPTINTNDAGIAEIRIRKPSSFPSWNASSVEVFTHHGTGVSHSEISSIKRMATHTVQSNCQYTLPALNEVRLCVQGDLLFIRFRAHSVLSNQVIGPTTPDKRIAIRFSQSLPTTAILSGAEYLVHVNNEKYNATHTDNNTGNNGLPYATTGWQRIMPGDAITGQGNSTLQVQVRDIPTGFASVTPNVIYVGSAQNLQTFIQTPNDPNNTGINRIEIEIWKQNYGLNANPNCDQLGELNPSNPHCYTDDAIVNLATGWGLSATNFALSDLFPTNITSTLTAGNTKAVINITGGNEIPGTGGLDKITLLATSTPTVLTPTPYRVKVRLFNTNVSTTMGHLAGTGTVFDATSQIIRLRPAKPIAMAKVAPSPTSACSSNVAAYAGNAAPANPNLRVCNTIKTNSVELTLTNNGLVGNDIKRVRIVLPDEVTAVGEVQVQLVQGANSFSFNRTSHPSKFTVNLSTPKYLEIEMANVSGAPTNAGLLGNVSPKYSAIITMELTDNVTPLTGNLTHHFTGYVENGNGDNITDNAYSQDASGSWTLAWVRPYARAKFEVYRATSFSYPIGNPAGNRELWNTSTNNTVRLSVQVYNPSVSDDATNVGNLIHALQITVPTGFTGISAVTSAKGGNITIASNQIRLDYPTPIPPGDNDIISFDVQEQCYEPSNNWGTTPSSTTNCPELSHLTFGVRVSNINNPLNFNTTVSSGYQVGPGYNAIALSIDSNVIRFVNQPLLAVGYAEVCHHTPVGTRCSTSETADNENNPLLADISLTENLGKHNVIRYYLKNLALPGGHIRQVRIYIRGNNDTGWTIGGADALNSSWLSSTQAFTNVTCVKNGSSAGTTATADPTYTNYYIDCDFSGAANGIDANDVAYVQFQMRHTTNMPANQFISLRARATNDRFPTTFKPDDTPQSHIAAGTSTQMPHPTYPEGSTGSIKIQISKPAASVRGFLTLTNQTNSAPFDGINVLRRRSTPAQNVTAFYYLENTGVGTNRVYKARIAIPTPWQGKVSVGGNSIVKNAPVSLAGTDILIDYDPANNGGTYLAPGEHDRIQLTLAHDINTEGHSLWALSATNDVPPDPIVYDNGTVYPQKSNLLYIITPARVRITSSQDVNTLNPGQPTQFYTTNTSPTLVLRVQNDNATGGRPIERIRIVYPTPAAGEFVINSVSSSIMGTISVPTTPNPIIINYSPPLAAGNLDDITINFKRNAPADPFEPLVHNWQVQVYYNDSTTDPLVDLATNFTGTGGDRLDVSDNVFSGHSLATGFVLPPLPVKAYISVNTAVFNNRGNHLGLAFPGWGNLDGVGNPPGDTYDTNLDDNGFTFVVKNETTLSGNHIRYLKITAPTIVQEISKCENDITIVRQPGSTTLTGTSNATSNPNCTITSNADCTSFTEDYCIETQGVPAGELVVLFNPGVIQGGHEIYLRTAITKNPSVTTPQSGAFIVQASNDPSGANLQTATTPIAEGGTNYDRSLTLYYYQPTELIEYYVEKKNPSDGESGNPTMLYKTESDHKVVLFLRNSGHASSQIRQFSVTLPPNVFTLNAGSKFILKNSANVTLTGGTHYTCATNCDHTNGKINANSFTIALENPHWLNANDFLRLELDNFGTAATANSGSNPYPLNNSTATNPDRFLLTAITNTSYTTTLNGVTLSGKQNFMQLKRPQPQAVAYLYEHDVQLETTAGVPLVNLNRDDSSGQHVNDNPNPPEDNTNFNDEEGKRIIRLIIENQGSGNNHITQVKIKAPNVFNGFHATNIEHDLNAYTGNSYSADPNLAMASGLMVAGDTITIDYNPGSFNTSTNKKSIISIPVNYQLLDLPTTSQTWQVIVKNHTSAGDCFSSPSDGCSQAIVPLGKTRTHSFVYPSGGLELSLVSGHKIWSINNQNPSLNYNGALTVRLRPRGNPLRYAALKLPVNVLPGLPVLGTITSKYSQDNGNCANLNLHHSNTILTVDYSACTGELPVDTADDITIGLSGVIPSNAVASHAVTGRFIYAPLVSNPPFSTNCSTAALVASDLNNNTANCLMPIVPQGQTNIYQIVRPPFANIKGNVLPLKDVFDNPLKITVSLSDLQGNILTDFNGNPLVAETDASGIFRFIGGFTQLKSGGLHDGPGIPMCASSDGFGCLDTKTVLLRFAAPGYETLVREVTITRGLELDIGNMGELAQEAFKPQAGKEHRAVGRQGANKCAEVDLPNDAISETFSLMVQCTNMANLLTSTEAIDQNRKDKAYAALSEGREKLNAPSNPANMPVYVMNIRDGKGQLIENIELFYRDKRQNINKVQVEGILRVYYDAQLMQSLGYDEAELAVFTFDSYRGVWVKLGGLVDLQAKTISVPVASLQRYYLVAASQDSGGMISDVVVTPRLFTPGHGRHFNRMTLQFQLREPVDKYEVAIFDLSGRLIIKFERPGTFGSGQIFWDGHDERGNLVAGGIYIYVIRAKNEKYRGTIVVTR